MFRAFDPVLACLLVIGSLCLPGHSQVDATPRESSDSSLSAEGISASVMCTNDQEQVPAEYIPLLVYSQDTGEPISVCPHDEKPMILELLGDGVLMGASWKALQYSYEVTSKQLAQNMNRLQIPPSVATKVTPMAMRTIKSGAFRKVSAGGVFAGAIMFLGELASESTRIGLEKSSAENPWVLRTDIPGGTVHPSKRIRSSTSE